MRISYAFLSIVLLLSLAITLPLAKVAQAADGPPIDFRGLAFGAELESIEGLTPVASKITKGKASFKDVYFRENENLSFDNAELRSVAYYFFEGKLRSVAVAIQGDVNAFLVKDQLIKTYGQGRQIGAMYGWTWEEFSLVMERREQGDMSILTYTHEPRQKTEE